jgi:hypothetical protein
MGRVRSRQSNAIDEQEARSAMLHWLLILGGLGHFALLPINLAVPRVLAWDRELASLRPFMGRLVWAYGTFILLTNLGFGALTLIGAEEIVNGTRLGVAFAAFVAVYWIVRLVIQYAFFDWSDFPQGALHQTARWLLDVLFAFLVAVYGYAAVRGLLRGG